MSIAESTHWYDAEGKPRYTIIGKNGNVDELHNQLGELKAMIDIRAGQRRKMLAALTS